jgi:hypothetical protein
MSLCCRSVTGVQLTISNNAGRESGDGSARTDPHATGNATSARVGHGGSPEDGKIFGRSQGLGLSLRREIRQGESEEKSRRERKTKCRSSIIHGQLKFCFRLSSG